MKRSALFSIVWVIFWLNCHSPLPRRRGGRAGDRVVFAEGKDGYPSIRIPALLTTQRGTLLALAEGRAAHADQAANQIILKRSSDGGRTWGPLQVIARDGENSLNNPCLVQERSTGRILLMIQSYPAGGKEFNGRLKPGVEGSLIVKNYLLASDDDGDAWTRPGTSPPRPRPPMPSPWPAGRASASSCSTVRTKAG